MTSVQVAETSVSVTNNSPSRDYSHLDDQTKQMTYLLSDKNSEMIRPIRVWKSPLPFPSVTLILIF